MNAIAREELVSTIFGLPLHPLVVHAVVVLVPLALLVAVVVAVSDTWRQRLATPLLLLVLIATGSAFLAKASGESLAELLPGTEAIEEHAEIGDIAAWPVLLFAIVTVLWWWRQRPGQVSWWLRGLLLVTGLLATVVVLRVGHLGAVATWGTP